MESIFVAWHTHPPKKPNILPQNFLYKRLQKNLELFFGKYVTTFQLLFTFQGNLSPFFYFLNNFLKYYCQVMLN
jgi:hypothetical protein